MKLTEASKKLIAYMQAKHGDKLKSMSFDQYQKAKKTAQDEMKVQSNEKRAVKKAAEPPKPVNAGEVQDRDVIVQMRKLSDYKPGKYKVRVSPKRSVSVHSDTARKVSAAHDALKKPNDKRKFRIQLLSRLRKLKEEVEIENLEVLKENIKAKIMQQSDDFGRIRLDEVLPALAIIGGAAATAARIGSAASRTAGAAARTPKPDLKLVKGGAPAVKPPTTLPNANPPVKSPTKPPNVVPIRKPVPEPAPSPAPRPATQPAPQPATSPAPRPATQPASSAAAAAAATSPAPRTAQSTAPRRPTRGARPQRRMPFPDLFGGGFQVDPEPDRYGTPPTYGQSTGRAIRYTPVFSQANRPGSYLASRLQK